MSPQYGELRPTSLFGFWMVKFGIWMVKSVLIVMSLSYLIMATLWNTAGHYTFFHPVVSSFSFFLLSFFRLFSTVADWMSTILPHVVWPYSKFRMHIWNLLHVACWKYRTQKIAKNLPSVHHRTTLSGYIFATKAFIFLTFSDPIKFCH